MPPKVVYVGWIRQFCLAKGQSGNPPDAMSPARSVDQVGGRSVKERDLGLILRLMPFRSGA